MDKTKININLEQAQQKLVPIVKKVISFIFSILSLILSTIHSAFLKTGHVKKCYLFSVLTIVYIVGFSYINYSIYKTYKNSIYSYNMSQMKSQVIESENIAKENTTNLETTIQSSLLSNIEDVLVSEKKKCIDTQVYKYIEDINIHTDINIYPSEFELEEQRQEISSNSCSVENLPDPYRLLLDKVFGSDSTVYKEYVKSGSKVTGSGSIQSDIQKIKDKIQLTEKKTNLVIVDQKGEFHKSKEDIKAVFCLAGHGLGKKGENDPGATIKNQTEGSRNGLGERDLTVKIMPDVCSELTKKLEGSSTVVYTIGVSEKMSLVDKIKKINEISEKNGYNEKNSIGIELHFNSLDNKDRSGVEVLYSQYKGDVGSDFANNTLKTIRQVHTYGNFYKQSSDEFSRYKKLGMVSDTKPNMLIVEYGFVTNPSDIDFVYNNTVDIQKSLVDSVISFIK